MTQAGCGVRGRQRKRGQRLAFSEVKIGDAYDSEAYEVEADEVKQTSAMWDPWEYHLDDASAEASLFEGATASGIHTLAIANLLGHYTGPDHDIVAWMGSEHRFPAPTRVGDVLVLTRSVLEARPSGSRPGHGVVTFHDTLTNQAGQVVLDQRATTLIGPGDS